jgi:hypothetical protein
MFFIFLSTMLRFSVKTGTPQIVPKAGPRKTEIAAK